MTGHYIRTLLHGHAGDGRVAINPQAADEIGPFTTYPPNDRRSLWASFNLGQFVFGQGRVWSLLPVVVWMVAGAWMLERWARRDWLRQQDSNLRPAD